VDCNMVKGKVFSLLSENKGVTIEDRDFPALAEDATTPVQGTVRCRDHGSFQLLIDKYLNNVR